MSHAYPAGSALTIVGDAYRQRDVVVPHDKGGGGYPIGLSMAIMRQAGLRGGDE
jgi:hypothetical protein